MVIGPVVYPPHPITFEQYMAEEHIKRRYDIVNGVRVFAVPPSFRHQRILGHFLSPFGDYADAHGYVTLFSLFDVLISWEPFCTRQPDVMLVSHPHMQAHKDGEPLSVAPDLVVEIVSSIDRELALENKIRDYAAIGVQECWVVRPDNVTVDVLRATLSGWEKAATCSETVQSIYLTGLSIAVTDILMRP